MCAHGDTVPVHVHRPEMVVQGVTFPARWSVAPIDRCIAPIVAALVNGGVYTIDSCCGHGRGPGSIILADGRWLVVSSGRAEALRMIDGREPATDPAEPGREE